MRLYLFNTSMKKYLYLALAICTLSACDQAATHKQGAEAKLPLQNFVSDFSKQHPDWNNNGINETKTNAVFAGLLDSFLRTTSALQGLQFKLESVNEYERGKYAVKLVNINLTDTANVEIIGLVAPALVPKLVEGNEYTFTGHYLLRLKELKPYYDYGLWNVDVGSDKVVDNKIYFGVSLYQIKDLKPL